MGIMLVCGALQNAVSREKIILKISQKLPIIGDGKPCQYRNMHFIRERVRLI